MRNLYIHNRIQITFRVIIISSHCILNHLNITWSKYVTSTKISYYAHLSFHRNISLIKLDDVDIMRGFSPHENDGRCSFMCNLRSPLVIQERILLLLLDAGLPFTVTRMASTHSLTLYQSGRCTLNGKEFLSSVPSTGYCVPSASLCGEQFFLVFRLSLRSSYSSFRNLKISPTVYFKIYHLTSDS